ncbi:MAG: DUF3592 domain-containing protein [Planctomycetaceae bacterium]
MELDLAIFIGVCHVVGFAILGYGLWSARKSTRAAAWPSVSATITKLEVREISDSESTTYEVKVEYAYTVAGTAYAGSRVAFGYAGSSGRKAHDEIHRKLREAKGVSVRYDPSAPSVSCLSYGMHRSIQFALAFAVAWLLFWSGFTLLWLSSNIAAGVVIVMFVLFVSGFTLLAWLFSRSDSVLLNNLSVQ